MSRVVPLLTRVADISKKLNIPARDVNEVLSGFIWFCKEELKDNKRLTVPGMFTIIPNDEHAEYAETFAYKLKTLSYEIDKSYVMVSRVVWLYLDMLKDDVCHGKRANIFGVVIIKPGFVNGELKRLETVLSCRIRSDLAEDGIYVRVHTDKVFARSLREAGIRKDDGENA